MQEIYERLKVNFPKGAYKSDLSRGKNSAMTTIGAQYIIDRLNTVLGLGRWSLTGNYDIEKVEGKVVSVIFHGKLNVETREESGNEVILNQFSVENIGYAEQQYTRSDNRPYKLVGDLLKSARTDCLSKCSSWIGVGDNVFKGLVAPGTAPKEVKELSAKEKLVNEINELAKKLMEGKSDDEKVSWMKAALEVNAFRELHNKTEANLNGKIDALKAMIDLGSL